MEQYNIDGTIYDKEDMLEMIHYYQSHHQVPTEMKHEIVKYLPYYRTLNKTLYKDKEAYYQRFCSQPISYNEFYNFIKDKLMFGYIFTPKVNGFYLIQLMGYNNTTVYDFNVLNNQLSVIRNNMPHTDFDVKKYVNKDSYYDMISSYYILKQRDCDYDDYIKNRLVKDMDQFSTDIPSTDIASYLYNLEKFIYDMTGKGYNFNASLADNMGYIKINPLNKYHFIMRPDQYDTSYKELLANLQNQLQKN